MLSTLKQILKLFWFPYVLLIRRTLLALLKTSKIDLLDVGSFGGLEPRWARVNKFINTVEIEADLERDESKKIFGENSLKSNVVGSRREVKQFYLTKGLGKSSIFKPNFSLLNRYNDVNRFEIISKKKVQIKRLDSLLSSSPDFIKLDIQGSELFALKGLGDLKKEVIAIETEIEFLELYSKQPLFRDLDLYLNKHQFEFLDFTNLRKWNYDGKFGCGQLVFGDAIYIRSIEKMKNYSYQKKVKYIAILLIYSRLDLADAFLKINKEFKLSKSFYRLFIILKLWDRYVTFISMISERTVRLFDPNYRINTIR